MNERPPGARFTSFTNGIDQADAFRAENSRFDSWRFRCSSVSRASGRNLRDATDVRQSGNNVELGELSKDGVP